MNTLSVSNKKWVLKKFNNNEVKFFKDNFLLDDITSKLLSIRKIKKEEIKCFLNPLIKHYLPDPENLNDMKKSSIRTIKAIETNEKNRNIW